MYAGQFTHAKFNFIEKRMTISNNRLQWFFFTKTFGGQTVYFGSLLYRPRPFKVQYINQWF